MLAVWPLLDGEDLDGTVTRWLRAVTPIVRQQRRESARLAGNYYRTYRTLELGVSAGDFTPRIVEEIAEQEIVTSMTVTGPAQVKKHMRTDPVVSRAMEIGRTMSARSAMRHALGGGRATVDQSLRADSQAIGYARATSGQACAFCKMIASRGPVFSKETVQFDAHDGCSCSHEPVFHRDAAWPAGSREYREQFDAAQREATADGELRRGTSNDALNAFRRSLSG